MAGFVGAAVVAAVVTGVGGGEPVVARGPGVGKAVGFDVAIQPRA